MFSRNVRNVCPLRHLPTLTKLHTLPTLRDGGNQELLVPSDAVNYHLGLLTDDTKPDFATEHSGGYIQNVFVTVITTRFYPASTRNTREDSNGKRCLTRSARTIIPYLTLP